MSDEQKSPRPGPSGPSKEEGQEASNIDPTFLENLMKSMGDMPKEEKIQLLEQKYKTLYSDLICAEKKIDHLEKKILKRNVKQSSSSALSESSDENQQGPSGSQETNVDIGGIPPPESGSVESLDSTLMDSQTASSSSTSVKETRSMPVTKKDHESISHEGSLKEPQSSGDLHEDLSLGDLPLYKPTAVTDVPTQGGHTTLVKESEGRTDIREPPSPRQ